MNFLVRCPALHKLDMEAEKPGWLQGIHPLPKLLITLFFLVLTVSYGKYNLAGLLEMGVYLIVLFVFGDISFKLLLKRMKAILALVCLMGIVNPFFDREVMFRLGGFAVTGGMISAVTLALKGIYAVSASYILIVTTSVEDICYALQRLHVPKVFVTVLMLVYRYIIVFLKETERMMDAKTAANKGSGGSHTHKWVKKTKTEKKWVPKMVEEDVYKTVSTYKSVCCCGDMTEIIV